MDDQNNQLTDAEAVARAQADAAAAAAAEAEAAAKAQADAAKVKRAAPRVRRQAIATVVNPMTAESSVQAQINEDDLPELPKQIKLAAPYAFYDDDGKLHSWAAGAIVTDADEIATLIERGALVEE